MPTQTEEAPPISSLSDDELLELAKSSPPLHELSDEDLLGVAVNQGLMQPDQANQILTQRKAAARAPVAEAVSDAVGSSGLAPAFFTKALLTKGGRAGDIAAEVAGPMIGSTLGATAGSEVPVVGTLAGGSAGGAAGATAGNALAQARQYFRGERDEVGKGELIGSAVAGAIPLGNTALTKPLVAIGKRALQGAGVAGVGDVTQQLVDQKPFDWAQLGQSLVGGALFGGIGGAAEVGVPKLENVLARRAVLKQIRQTPEFSKFTGTDAELAEAVRAKMARESGRPTEPINVTDTAPAAGTEEPFSQPFAESQAEAARAKAPLPAPLAETSAAPLAEAAEAPKPLAQMSDDELRALAKETAPRSEPPPPMQPHEEEVATHAMNSGLLEQTPSRGPVSIALQEKYPELTHIPENHTPIEIKGADGTVYPATISGYADNEGNFPWIGRLTDHGWSHGHLRSGESIVTPVPTPQQWAGGMRELPEPALAPAADASGLRPLPEGARVQYLGKKHLVMEGIGEPADQWQLKMPGEVGPGRTVTAEHLAAEGFQAPQAGDPFAKLMERFGKKAALESAGQHLLDEAHANGQTADQIVDHFFSSTWKQMPSEARNKLGDWLASNVGLTGAGNELTPATIKEYYTPGRTLKNGDKVVSYTPREGERMGIVQVKGEDGRIRTHATAPTYKDALRELGKERLSQTQGRPDKFWRAVNFHWPDLIKDSLGANDLSELRGEERGIVALLLDAKGKFEEPASSPALPREEFAGEGGSGKSNTLETHAMGGSISRGPRAPAPSAPKAAGPVDRIPPAQAPSPTPIPPPPNGLVKDLQRVQRLVAPQTIDSSSRFAANLLRELNSKMANEMARADHSLRQYRNSFDTTPVPKNWKYEKGQKLPRNYAFIDAYEGGRFSGLSPKEHEAAVEFRKQNAALIDRVHALGTGALRTFYENYFPHIWNDPTQAKQVMAAILGKRPLEGGKSFLQQRTHQLFTDGLEAGLTPVHDNPIDLWLLKKREVERYILGQTFVKQMKEAGLLKFVHAFSQKPEGYSTVNDRAFTVYGPPTVTIQEAFDAGMREKTLQALEALGVPHERVAKLRGDQWGYEQNLKDTPGSEHIVTKFGGPDSVIWHELGHALDSRYPQFRDTMAATPQMKYELRALADLRAEGEKVSDSHQKYLRSTPEKMATILQAYLHAPERMEEVAPNVKKAFEEFLNSKPELSVINEISPTLRIGSGEMELPVGGQVTLGHWYMPDSAAHVMNNFLSPGLNSHLWYRSLREVSNLMNAAQLSMSAFHLGFTSIDAMVSNFALAIEDAYHKEYGSALKTALGTPLAPITNFIAGSKLRSAVLENAANSEMKQLVDYLEKGGGRVGQDPLFDHQMSRKMTRAFALTREQIKSGDFLGGISEATKTFAYALLGALEKSQAPIHAIVVRQKLGVIANMASRDIRRLGPNATPEQIREVAQKAVDSASNRMGQMEYDNMMMNRVIKDTMLASFRSAGWQTGKAREGGGAVLDAAEFVRNKAAGREATPSRRMFYVASLVAVTGVIGAIVNYLYTGEAPKSLRDCFQPRTGELDQNGNPVRINLPTYLKDVFAFYRHPVTTVVHALAPWISAASDLLANKDFYGYQIRNPNDPLWQQGSDVAKWAMSEIRPFSVSGALELHKNDSPLIKTVMPFFGFAPVSMTETMTPAQELAREIMSANMPSAPRDRNKYDKNQLLKGIIQQIKAGHAEQGKKMLADGLDKGILDVNTTRLLMDHLKYTPLQFQVHHFTPEASMRVFRIASDAEKNQLRGIISVKVLGSKTLAPNQKAAYLKELQSKIPALRAAESGNN